MHLDLSAACGSSWCCCAALAQRVGVDETWGQARGKRWGCGAHPHPGQIAQRCGDFVPDEPLFRKLPSRCTSTRSSRSDHDIVVNLAVLRAIVFLSATPGLTRPPCASQYTSRVFPIWIRNRNLEKGTHHFAQRPTTDDGPRTPDSAITNQLSRSQSIIHILVPAPSCSGSKDAAYKLHRQHTFGTTSLLHPNSEPRRATPRRPRKLLLGLEGGVRSNECGMFR